MVILQKLTGAGVTVTVNKTKEYGGEEKYCQQKRFFRKPIKKF